MSRVCAKAVFLSALFLSVVPLRGAVLHVPGDFPGIQPALDTASAGDTVLLSDGVYSGALSVNLDFRGKPIALRSESAPRRR